jgi:hypothetical protein
MKGTLITGDLQDNTLTFEMEEAVVIKAGQYTITEESDNNEAIKLLQRIVDNRNKKVSWDELKQSISNAETFLTYES